MSDPGWYLRDGIPVDLVLRRRDGSGFERGDGKPLTPEQEQALIDMGEAVRTPDGLRPIPTTLAARLHGWRVVGQFELCLSGQAHGVLGGDEDPDIAWIDRRGSGGLS